MTGTELSTMDGKGSGRPDHTEEAKAQYNAALRLAKGKHPETALEPLLEVANWSRGKVAKKVRRGAHEKAAWCLAQLQDWVQLEQVARLAAHRYPDCAWPFRYLGEAIWRMGKRKKAIAYLEQAIELGPLETEARTILEIMRSDVTVERMRPAGWPARQRLFKDAREVIRQYVLRGQRGEPFIGPDTVFMTFGSCFAENLAARLRDAGHTVNSEAIGEEINSTYANRHLLEWVENGAVDAPTELMDRVYGEAVRERLKAHIESSDVFVMTLGLAPYFVERGTDDFAFYPLKSKAARDFLHASHEMRTSTVSENIRNLNLILDSLRRIAKRSPKIVLTVSPVPLSGTTEFGSAVIADCISKSILRLACHEVASVRAADDVIYWPSFEIVRWLGPHFGPEHGMVYGQDDENTRHVSRWIVGLIIDLFLEHYTADGERSPDLEDAAAALPAAGP